MLSLLGVCLGLMVGCGVREEPSPRALPAPAPAPDPPPSPKPPAPSPPPVPKPKISEPVALVGDSVVPWTSVNGDVEVAYEIDNITSK